MYKVEAAQSLALQALSWLAQDMEHIGGFLGASGLGIDELRVRAAEPDFLAAVMDYLLTDEALLLAFCRDCNVKPEAPLAARAALPGGEVPHWT